MGYLLSRTALLFVLFFVTFKEDVTRAYHLPEDEVSTAEVKSFIPTESKDSRFWSSAKRGSELKNLISQPQSTAPGNKRALPAAALAVLKNPKVQEAAVDKGIEVVGKMVDKTLENVEHAQNKAAEFLKKEIKLDITPEKAWISDDMFVPSAYHLDASIEDNSKSPVEEGETPFTYPAGVGQILMNGCWGKDYKIGDPCYNAKENSSICRDMIDGAAFIGVGFDGSGEYSPESRKMSIVQRNCVNKATYDDLDVPDTMNVHGIYETSAFTLTFENRAEYQTYLQHQAGVSGSIFGFSAGVKKAWGGSMQTSTQQYMAALYVDAERYEIFMDEIKPSDLSLSFLREFMELPISYFQPGAQIKYQNFIQRWGTHYIKSAKFGGQLQIRKTMEASQVASKYAFAEKMEMEFRFLFASAGAKSSTEGGQEAKAQNKFTSTSVMAQGGSQEIATILSDVYSPTFKSSLREWLQSIPNYPKAFRFLLGSIVDLVNFRANDLFSAEDVDWGCEGNVKNIVEETRGETTERYYTVTNADGRVKKFYCPFQDREELDVALRRRRSSLNRAIEIFMAEGPISVSDMVISKCTQEDKTTEVNDGFFLNTRVPKWKEIVQENSTLTVKFDMETDLARGVDGLGKIEKNMTREVKFTGGRWFTADEYGKFHLYSGYRNGKSGELRNHKLSIFGLVLSYNSKHGSLDLIKEDFNESKRTYPTLREEMIGFPLAHLTVTQSYSFHDSVKRGSAPSPAVTPCNVKWSNALRLDPTTTGGRCLHFTASSAGDFFVVFATIPSRRSSWYYVQIGVRKVAIYKGEREVTSTSDTGSVSIGDALLYQSYFVCLYEKPNSTLIEYGKSLGISDGGDIYLTYLDANDPLQVRFYAFGNMDKVVKIWDAHITPRDLTDADCKGSTYKDLPTNLCFLKCHEYCDPFAGCKNAGAKDLRPSDCLACRVAKDPVTNVCLEKCPENTQPDEKKECLLTFDAKTIVPGGVTATSRYLKRWQVSGVKVQDMPALNHMTLCLWTKFPQTNLRGIKMTGLARYYDTNRKSGFFLRTVEYDKNGGGYILFALGHVPKRKTLRFSRAFLDDNEWHRLCIAWNGVSGVTKVYVDGVQDKSAKFGKYAVGGLLKDSLPGGGTLEVLTVHSQVVYVSELNLWDKVLSAVEISESSKLCFGKQGNVKKWSDFWPAFSKYKSRYEAPSQCKSPIGSSEEMMEEDLVVSNGSDEEMMEEGLVVSENRPFPPNAKKRRAFKYARKGQKKSHPVALM